ncbi:hypothetical protein, partial [Amycolatopsis sp.]|uniref:hypothetical protein n=1 Tax=Amycolatopsis sp. TaxID=37632 RepID=UPI002DFFF1AD|nr:hypothetical protein [Amycolatopsis sp.]
MITKHVMRSMLAVLAAGALSLALTPTAGADLAFTSVGASLTGPDGTFSRQAGEHSDLTIHAEFSQPATEPVRDFDVDLPVGLTGNPVGLRTCSLADLQGAAGAGVDSCPASTRVGSVVVEIYAGAPIFTGVYNLDPGSDAPAKLGFNFFNTLGIITARVRPGDYGISSGSFAISQAQVIKSVTVTLWGVPSDPIHDADRNGPSPVPGGAFMTNPTSCTDSPVAFTARGDSWSAPGRYATEVLSADPDGTPFVFDGCERLPFEPSIDVQPLSHTADAPTGLNVDLTVPQNDAPYGLASAHVRKAVVTLPKGMSVSPSSAAGLGACAPSEIGLGTNNAPTCPASSRIGTVRIDTPLLADPLEGDVILAKQDDNPFHSLLALYFVVKGPGFYVKLPGRV